METAPTTIAQSTVPTDPRVRLEFVDNLRWVMIVLVVSMHAAVTYSHLGSWYFMEDPKPGQVELVIFAAYQMFLQAFFMGLLFLVAGYFVPAAYERKGFGKFLRDRAVRLGIPSLLFMLLIQPLTVYWLLRAFANPSIPSLAQAYPGYVLKGRFLGGSGPMWFAVALLLFSVVYAVSRSLNRKPLQRRRTDSPLPGNAQVIWLILAMALCTFLVRIVQPMGTNILNMQLCFFSQYILLFIVGLRAWRGDWLHRIPYQFGMRWVILALVFGSASWLAIILAALKAHQENNLSGGWNWQSAALCLWEAFFCVGACLGFLVLFREKFNRQGRLARWLSDNAFCVYVFHPPILIALTLAMKSFEAPKLLKFLCASALGAIVTYVVSSLIFRRIPVLKRVL